MKTGKKIAVLLLVFIAAAAIYFVWPMGHKEKNGESVTYTVMGAPTLPVVYPTVLGQETAPLFGHREEKAVTADRGSLLVLPEDRKLSVRIENGSKIESLQYEIRSMDMEHLVERTELTDWDAGNDELHTTLPIQNLLQPEEEYRLGIQAVLKDGTSVWYYARVVETENSHVGEMIALAEEFSSKTFHYDSAQDLTMYMESSPDSDNSSFGVVTLKNSFTLMTWGSLNAVRGDKVYVSLKELSGDLANIQLEYTVTRDDEGARQDFIVTENFTMKWTNQRIYMMDYQRTMNQEFSGERNLYSGKRIILGITDGEDMYTKKSAGGQFTAFVVNRELWTYNSADSVSARVFSFGGADTEDLRARLDRHDVEILEVSDSGDVDFLVYGYMNRGSHEGCTGVTYNHYNAEDNTLEEQFFLPAAEPFEELKEDLQKLAHKGDNGIFYIYMGGAVYGIDLKSHEYVVVATGLSDDRFAVSGDGSRLAWQENTGVYDSGALHLMDLDTGDKTQIGDGKSGVYKVLGFVGSDCVYGIGEPGDYITSNGRVMGLYLKSLDIVDRNMQSAMHYEKNGNFIRDVVVDDSRIHLKLVTEKNGGFFGNVTEDTLVCNVEALPGKQDDIGWYASDAEGRVYFVQLGKDIAAGQQIKSVSPKKFLLDAGDEIVLPAADAGTEMEFYAYGRGRLLGRYLTFAEAAGAAYDCMGFVAAGRNDIIWARANKGASYYIRDISSASRRLERYQSEFTGVSAIDGETLLLDASGCTLNEALYFVGRGMIVLIYTGEGKYLYLTGYDQAHVRTLDPATGQVEIMAIETARDYFDQLGNDYICCVPVE